MGSPWKTLPRFFGPRVAVRFSFVCLFVCFSLSLVFVSLSDSIGSPSIFLFWGFYKMVGTAFFFIKSVELVQGFLGFYLIYLSVFLPGLSCRSIINLT